MTPDNEAKVTESRCECPFCKDYARLKTLESSLPEESRAWVNRIFEGMYNAQEELSYKQAILDGTWPDSVPMLERALHRAKSMQAPRAEGRPGGTTE